MAAGCKYLSKQHLQGFSSYKYSSIETNPLTLYVLIPWWNTVVKLFPLWVAPNLITVVGFLLLLSIFCLLWYFDPDYLTTSNDYGIVRPPIPSWVWIYAGIAQFTAHTLDGIDGKQARRTGTSSPLGELFDHGLDSFGCILLPLAMYSAIGRGTAWGGPPIECYWVVVILMTGFYFSHWEKYVTGTLYLPWVYDLGEVGGVLFYLLTGTFGVRLWHFYTFKGWNCAYMIKWAFIVGFLITIPVNLYNVYLSLNKPSDTEPGSSPSSSVPVKSRSFLLPGLPIALLFSLSTTWVIFSPTDILSQEPRLFMVVIGIIFSNITCRLIIAQMSSQPSEAFNYLFIPLVVAIGTSFVQPHFETLSLYALGVVAFVAHLHFGIMIVMELSSHFKINVFSISKPPASPRR